MILCFGTFAGVLNRCRIKAGLPQKKFVSRIAWIVDPMNSCLGIESDIDHEISSAELDGKSYLGNATVVSKILSGKLPLTIKNARQLSVEIVKERFKEKVMPFIDNDKVAKAMAAILAIISEDESIETKHNERFKKQFGLCKTELLRQTKFNAPDFFARVLLYVISIDDKEGRSCAKEITDSFVENICKDIWAELKWDVATQTVEIIPTAEKRLHDEICTVSRLWFLGEDYICSDIKPDISWTGVDERSLFPGLYPQIELDAKSKKIMHDKMAQYVKLLHEFGSELRSAESHSAMWPIFPNEKIKNISQKLSDLQTEMMVLCIVKT